MKTLQEQFAHLLKDENERAALRQLLGGIPLFATLTASEVDAVLQVGEIIAYDPGETVFEQDETSDALHIVLEGTVLLVRVTANRGAKTMGERGHGATFGEIDFLTRAKQGLRVSVGDKECLQLVIPRDRFEELLNRIPQIGFKVYAAIVDSIHKRMTALPIYFRNYMMWGFLPSIEMREILRAPMLISKSIVLPLGGALGGAVGVYALQTAASVWWPEIARGTEGYLKAAILGMAIILGIAGLIIGFSYDWLEEIVARQRRSDRSCANCQFIHWSEDTAAFSCTYKERELHHVTIRPGVRFDTYTDCPSFTFVQREAKSKPAA